MANPIQKSSPTLLVQEITDVYSRTNFKNLSEYFQAQNQLLGFKFFDITFTKAQANYTQAHGLGIIPQDILVTRVTGAGTITFNTGLFTSSNFNISVTGACRVRFYAGTYWNNTPTGNSATTDGMTYGPPTALISAPNTLKGNNTSASGAPVDLTTAQVAALLGLTTSATTGAVVTVPTGGIISWPTSAPPLGWLLCNGAAVSRTTYAALFAVHGTTFGAGDGSTTFNLPNTAGLFISGVGSQVVGGLTYTRTLGTLQNDTTKKNGLALVDNGHTHTWTSVGGGNYTGVGSSGPYSGAGGTPYTQTTGGANSTPMAMGAGDAETRPANIGLYQIIKT